MQWDETSLFLHLEPVGIYHGVDRQQTLEMSSRDIQAYNESNNYKGGLVIGVQPHTLRSTSPLRNPRRVDLYT
jgi:hypothetical protein